MMYYSNRSIQVRNISLAVVNGSITLIVLLIAPLGIVAVMVNTMLVTAATYVTAMVSDRITLYLQGDTQRTELLDRQGRSIIRRVDDADLDRR